MDNPQYHLQPLPEFLSALSAKQPTPGGGGAAAVVMAIGEAAAAMAAIYTKGIKQMEEKEGETEKEREEREKRVEKAKRAGGLLERVDVIGGLGVAGEDGEAYLGLQDMWRRQRNGEVGEEEKKRIEARALGVVVGLVERCGEMVKAVEEFLPFCNRNIASDAKVFFLVLFYCHYFHINIILFILYFIISLNKYILGCYSFISWSFEGCLSNCSCQLSSP